MILKYSNQLINPPIRSRDYAEIDWNTLMQQEVDGVFKHTNTEEIFILYKGQWLYLNNFIEGRILYTVCKYGHTHKTFYRSRLSLREERIPYEVINTNSIDSCLWTRTNKPLSLTRKVIYALPKWIRRWIPGINT